MFPTHMLPNWNGFEIELANHLWQSTAFAAVAGGLTLLFRKNTAIVRYRLWLIASVKFLIPFSLLIGLGGHLGWHVVSHFNPSLPPMVRQMGQPFVPSLEPLKAYVPARASSMAAIFAVVWFCGVVTVTILWFHSWSRVARIRRSAGPSDIHGEIGTLHRLSRIDGSFDRIRILTSPVGVEPGVFGVLRPVLLMPEGIARNLTSTQLEAVVAHEIFHVRGRDNLAAAVHTIVEAIFWFHPLVWWLGSRLVDERERACDEAVLQMGCEPDDYAEGILRVCKCYLKAPECMAGVSGINLKKRIEAIMDYRGTRKLNSGMKMLLVVAGAGMIIGPLLTGMMDAAEVRTVSIAAPPAPVLETVSKAVAAVVRQAPAPVPQQNPARPAVQEPNDLQHWPEEVEPIITGAERSAFNRLQTVMERENFVAAFWLQRDPTPGTPENEFEDEYYRRIAYANDHFTMSSGVPGWQTDRGRMSILNGPPDEIQSHPTAGTYYQPAAEGGGSRNTYPFEQWRYRHIDGKGDNIIYEFVDVQMNGDYRLQYDPSAKLK